MEKTVTAYVGLGSNLGDRRRYIETAVKMLASAPELRLLRASRIIETPPLGPDGQPDYLNAVAELTTQLDAPGLLKRLGQIETLLGRVRRQKWEPRPIDLDLLLFGQAVINEPGLVVPHPRMHLRSFVLAGLCELNPELPHPVFGLALSELARRLNGCDFALDPGRPQLVSVAGIIGAGKTTLAEKLTAALGCEVLLEAYDTNPFLPQVYAGKNELALDCQLYFLSSRVAQLDGEVLAPGRIVVSDYVFEKEMIYARRLLSAQQLALYQRIYARLAGSAAAPVLVIYLWGPVEACLERIRSRNRPYEQGIKPAFLEALNADYEQLFAEWKRCPVIRLNCAELDYSKPGTVSEIANQVRYYVAEAGKLPVAWPA